MSRTYYSNNQIGTSTTTSTSYVDANILTLTTEASTNYAVFWTALVDASVAAKSVVVRVLCDGTTHHESGIYQHSSSSLKRTVTGVTVFEEGVSPGSTDFKLQFKSFDGTSVRMYDSYLTVMELVATDVFSTTLGETSSINATGADGDSEYTTLDEITVPAGNFSVMASSSFEKVALYPELDGNEVRNLIWDDTNNNAYGYVDGLPVNNYLAGTTTTRLDVNMHYWYATNITTAGSTNLDYRVQAEPDSTTGFYTIQYPGYWKHRTILALDQDAFSQTIAETMENAQVVTSTSSGNDTDCVVSAAAEVSGNKLIVASAYVTSGSSSIAVNTLPIADGTALYTTTTPSFISTSAQSSLNYYMYPIGFVGVVNVTAGTGSYGWEHWNASTNTSRIGRASMLSHDLDNENGVDWNTKYSGVWEAAQTISVKTGGTWKTASDVYVKDSGAWKTLIKDPARLAGNTGLAISSEYSSNFTALQGFTVTRSRPNIPFGQMGGYINEGMYVDFILTTVNVPAGTSVPYTITGISAADITGPLTGNYVVGTTDVIRVTSVADNLTEGTETITFSLDNGADSTTVAILEF